MLSRFSSLFAYVVVGLVISTGATPTAPSSDSDGGSKSPSHPDSSYSSPTSPKYPADKPYAEGKSYPKEKHPEEKRPEEEHPKDKYSEAKPPYPQEKPPYAKADGKDKASGDRPQAQYPSQKQPYAKGDDKDKSYADHPKYDNQCNVDKQVCCNGYNEVSHWLPSKPSYLSDFVTEVLRQSKDEQHAEFLHSLDSYFGMTDITQKIRDSNKFWSTNCSQSGANSPCKAQPMCCEENHWVGVVPTSSFSFIDVVHH